MEALIVIAILGALVWWLSRRGRRSSPSVGLDKRPDVRPPLDRPELPEQALRPPQNRGRPAGRLPTTRTTSSAAGAVTSATGVTGWVPLGESISVRGRTIPGGVYVGSSLRGSGMSAVSEWRGTEPALIDPRLKTNDRDPDRSGSTMDYWPSYADLTPSARAAYLDWLAAGRPAGAYVGYVFLSFYGIERRVLVDARDDATARAEVPELLREVERLLSMYGRNGSFGGYASSFLAVARLIFLAGAIDELEPPSERSAWQLPVEIQLAVGSMVEHGRPIPAEWALSWLITNPAIWLRTAATRCPDEFGELFKLRYGDRYGEGLRVRRPKRRMTLSYRPASASFGGSIELTSDNLPDITSVTAPTTKLTELANETIDELDRFSRYVGKTDDRNSLAAAALLPAALLRGFSSDAVDDLTGPIDQRLQAEPSFLIAASDLVDQWPLAMGGRLSKRDASSLASLLQAKGIGLEPDARYGATNFSHHEQVVLWRLGNDVAEPTPAFAPASAILRLGVLLAQADGEVSGSELEQLERQIEQSLQLGEHDRRRLHAHLQWLVSESLGFSGMRKHVGELAPQQRATIAKLVLAVAAADGRLHTREMNALTRAYRLLELDPAAIHRDLHALAAGDHEPISVLEPDSDLGDRAIPTPPVAAPTSPPQIVLDRSRIDRVLASTQEVGAVLTAVFADEEPEEPALDDAPDDEDADATAVAGLDPAHSELVRRIATQPHWSRGDFEALAGSLGLLPAGAVEAVNEAAFDATGEPLLEGDDELEVNGHALKEMLND